MFELKALVNKDDIMGEARIRQLILTVLCIFVAYSARNGFITLVMLAVATYGNYITCKIEDREEQLEEERQRATKANNTDNTQNKQ